MSKVVAGLYVEYVGILSKLQKLAAHSEAAHLLGHSF